MTNFRTSKMSKVNAYAATVLALLSLSSCSGSSATPTTTVPATTTVVVGDPQPELDKLAASLKAVDYSRISESSCGKFALIVAPEAVHFYEWRATGWAQNDSRFGDWTPSDAFLVTTRDYTDDGATEFLVNFARKSPIGAIFGQIDCEWQWLPFQPQMGNEQRTVDALTWSDDTKTLLGDDYDSNWTKLTSAFTWDSHYLAFYAQPATGESVEVSADCAYYMDQNTYYVLSNRPTGYTYIYESLINCTRAEWLSYADSHRSEFAKWDTYINAYYPYNFAGNGILLADTDATETLDYVCMKQKAVRSGSDLTQLKKGACS